MPKRKRYLDNGGKPDRGFLDYVKSGVKAIANEIIGDKAARRRMISDLQDFGILPRGGENGQVHAVVAPGITDANRLASNAIKLKSIEDTYDKAVKANDLKTAYILRHKHFDAKSTGSNASKSLYTHGTKAQNIKSFDVNRTGQNYPEISVRNGKGVYLDESPYIGPISEKTYDFYTDKSYHSVWGPNTMNLRVNFDEVPVFADDVPIYSRDYRTNDGFEAGEAFVTNPKLIKSADAITYDDAGKIIPLSQRDNFNINDIRYGLLPFIGLGAGYTASKYLDEQRPQHKDGGRISLRNGRKIKQNNGISDSQYYNIMRKVANDNYRNWGFDNPEDAYNHAINDRTYDYRGYYNKYPNGQGNSIDHWTDEFKTVYHPTFSDESIYSGKVHPVFNPNGFTGGMWLNDIYIPPKYQSTSKLRFSSGGSIHIAPSKRGTFTAAATRHGMGVQEFANTVLRNKDRYSPSLVKKANFARNASKWNH